MKCSIDNKCPRAASHLKTKAKKNALMEDRFAQIENENRLLLEKMSHIMRVSYVTCLWGCRPTRLARSLAHRFRMQFKGGIDCTNDSVKYSHSLSKERRRRELQRITKENQKILKRIQDARPTYNHIGWEEEAQRNREILENISEFKTRPVSKAKDDDVFDDFGYLDFYDSIK